MGAAQHQHQAHASVKLRVIQSRLAWFCAGLFTATAICVGASFFRATQPKSRNANVDPVSLLKESSKPPSTRSSNKSDHPTSLISLNNHGMRSIRDLIQRLESCPVGMEESLVSEFSALFVEARVTKAECDVFCEWVAGRKPQLAVDWLQRQRAGLVNHYGCADSIIRTLSEQEPVLSKDLLVKYPNSSEAYCIGLLYGNHRSLFDAFVAESKPSGWLAAMRAEATFNLRHGGRELLSSGIQQAESSTVKDAAGGRKGGINSSRINSYFQVQDLLGETDGNKIADPLRASSWFGNDPFETSLALGRLAKVDSRLALDEALQLSKKMGIKDSSLVQPIFQEMVMKDENAALDFLQNASDIPEYVPAFVMELYSSAKSPDIRAQCAQIIEDRGWDLPVNQDN